MANEHTMNIFMLKHLYDKAMLPIAQKHKLKRIELDILLFLANNPKYDTAADMIVHRGLSKSQVSMSVQHLLDIHLLHSFKEENDKKKIHLRLMKKADGIIQDGQAAQKAFFSLLFKDFSLEERKQMETLFERMNKNIMDISHEKKR